MTIEENEIRAGMILQDKFGIFYIYDIQNNDVYYFDLKNFINGEEKPGKGNIIPINKRSIEQQIREGKTKRIKQ